jgi:hypothetical protein
MPIMLELRALPLALLLTLSLAACDKRSGDGKSGVACPTDALVCPDGTALGRQGPNCEFPACPASDPSKDEPAACTKDAKVCPDGSVVGRQGPDCEFAPCPGEAPK